MRFRIHIFISVMFTWGAIKSGNVWGSDEMVATEKVGIQMPHERAARVVKPTTFSSLPKTQWPHCISNMLQI